MQAGVAMGLAKTVAVRFPEWGPEFATLMVRRLMLTAPFCNLPHVRHQSCAVNWDVLHLLPCLYAHMTFCSHSYLL